MKLSTKGRYGTRAMLDMALHHDQSPISLKQIAERQDISRRYLEHLMVRLVSSGLVRSVRGRGGGFTLTRAPSEIALSEIMEALEGPINVVECEDDPSVCNRVSECVTREVWHEVSQVMMDYMGRITLEEMCRRHREKQSSGMRMYYI